MLFIYSFRSMLHYRVHYNFFFFSSDENPMRLLLNVGGPERVSRLQMAEKVADVRGHDSSLIKAVSASSVRHQTLDTF